MASSDPPPPPPHCDEILRIGQREADWLHRLLDSTLCCVIYGELYTTEAWFEDVMDRWCDTPEPYLSAAQIRALLGFHLGDLDGAATMIQAACDQYVASLPSSRRGRTPRSLLHLCRCAVRETLKGNGEPIAFQHLGLPKDLVPYLEMKLD